MKMNALSRRSLIAVAVSTVATIASRGFGQSPDKLTALSKLEFKSGGKLGVCILDTQSGEHIGHRVDERFGMCSSFKLPLAAVVLNEADHDRLRLDEVIPYTKVDVIGHAPVAEKNLTRGGMTVEEMAQAAQEQSDNTTTNLLLKRLGGPAAFTKALRQLGDLVTRLDHFEPEMNKVQPGEVHDTTTPRAMAQFMSQVLTGSLLKSASQDKLIGWMIATETGATRLRAGLPKQWRAGDKTGSWWGKDAPNRINDVAIVWPPNRAPVIITAYFVSPVFADELRDEDQAVLAEVGTIAAHWALQRNPSTPSRQTAHPTQS
jgi:beta-lactamase class A